MALRLLSALLSASVRACIVPLFQVGLGVARLLILLDRVLPRLLGLFGIFRVGALARIVVGFFLAHRCYLSCGNPKAPERFQRKRRGSRNAAESSATSAPFAS